MMGLTSGGENTEHAHVDGNCLGLVGRNRGDAPTADVFSAVCAGKRGTRPVQPVNVAGDVLRKAGDRRGGQSSIRDDLAAFVIGEAQRSKRFELVLRTGERDTELARVPRESNAQRKELREPRNRGNEQAGGDQGFNKRESACASFVGHAAISATRLPPPWPNRNRVFRNDSSRARLARAVWRSVLAMRKAPEQRRILRRPCRAEAYEVGEGGRLSGNR